MTRRRLNMRITNKRIYGTILLLLVLAGHARGQSQEAVAELKKLNAQFSGHRYEFTMVYNLYESYTGLKPVETQTMDIKMWELMVNIRTRHFQVIKNKEHYLYVSHDQKAIMLNSVKDYSGALKELKEVEKMINLDTIIKSYSKIEKLNHNGMAGYRFYMKKNANYAYVDMFIDGSAHSVSKLIMYYAKTAGELYGDPLDKSKQNTSLPRMEISILNFKTVPVLNEAQFSIAPYLTRKGKEYRLVPSYQQYQFINHTY